MFKSREQKQFEKEQKALEEKQKKEITIQWNFTVLFAMFGLLSLIGSAFLSMILFL